MGSHIPLPAQPTSRAGVVKPEDIQHQGGEWETLKLLYQVFRKIETFCTIVSRD
jgi:hypothetical protein